ncbi:MAG: ribbon-helix-helix protein, CopG family [Chloroflexi bacterium]|nr:ribbon-helix-helix protein, CopG family [Chloroflexota bacterium]
MVQTNPTRKKSTFFISQDLLAEIKQLLAEKRARSRSALVEEALRDYIARMKRETRRERYVEASRDPLFLSDLEEIETDFSDVDAETARMIS